MSIFTRLKNWFLTSSNSYNFYKNNYEKLLEENKQYKSQIKTLQDINDSNQNILNEITRLDNDISCQKSENNKLNNFLEKQINVVNDKLTTLEEYNIENNRYNDIIEELGRQNSEKLKDIEDINYFLVDNNNKQNEILEENQEKIDSLNEKADMIIIDVNEYYNILNHLNNENYENSIRKLDDLKEDIKYDIKSLDEKTDLIVLDINEYFNILNQLINELPKKTNKELAKLDNDTKNKLVRDILSQTAEITKTSRKQIEKSFKNIDEVRYAMVFNDTIKNSDWLKDTEFSLNNAASNYSFMYILYRILNDIKPESILELGLGQTTRMTNQYAIYQKINHLVIESDKDWIETFSQNLNLNYTNIQLTDIKHFQSAGKPNLKYANLEEKIGNNKFDLVIVDGPQGFIPTNPVTFPKYPRSNIWDIIDNLNDEFIIVFDDYDRIGEQNTVEKLIEKLEKEHDIKCYIQIFYGLKYQIVVMTEKYRFIQWL